MVNHISYKYLNPDYYKVFSKLNKKINNLNNKMGKTVIYISNLSVMFSCCHVYRFKANALIQLLFLNLDIFKSNKIINNFWYHLNMQFILTAYLDDTLLH